MKIKKIKELTEKELESICNKRPFCENCPLELQYDVDSVCILHILENFKDFNKRLDVEIEVEDDK